MFKKLSNILKTDFKASSSGPTLNKIKNGSNDFISLIENWENIVGNRLAEHTIPIKNTYKTLTILTDHSAFSQQLSFMEEVLKQKIIKHYPCFRTSIRRIKFQTNSLHFSNLKVDKTILKTKQNITANKFHKFSPEYQKIANEANLEFKTIETKEIKDILTSIFVQNRYQKNCKSSTDK